MAEQEHEKRTQHISHYKSKRIKQTKHQDKHTGKMQNSKKGERTQNSTNQKRNKANNKHQQHKHTKIGWTTKKGTVTAHTQNKNKTIQANHENTHKHRHKKAEQHKQENNTIPKNKKTQIKQTQPSH